MVWKMQCEEHEAADYTVSEPRKQRGQGVGPEIINPSRNIPSDPFLQQGSTFKRFYSSPKQHHQLETKCSNTGV